LAQNTRRIQDRSCSLLEAGEALHDGTQDPIRQGLLQLHLFEALGLDHELLEALLDDVTRLASSEAPRDEQDGEGREAADDEDGGGHRYQTLMSTMRRMKT
jgi:hypothetical protein